MAVTDKAPKIQAHRTFPSILPVSMIHVLILGCGFTGQRVARRFLLRGASVTVTTRDPARLAPLAQAGACVITLADLAANLHEGVRVLHPPAHRHPAIRSLPWATPPRASCTYPPPPSTAPQLT